eukprot:COSAG01_NODE_729_length_14031_cov_24.502800_2_plen_179_part_00
MGSQELGEHTGYLTPFEAVLTAATVEECCCGSECTVAVTLDGGRTCDKGGCSDALMGAADDDTDGTGLGGWAGLNGHVSIECRPPVFIDVSPSLLCTPLARCFLHSLFACFPCTRATWRLVVRWCRYATLGRSGEHHPPTRAPPTCQHLISGSAARVECGLRDHRRVRAFVAWGGRFD